MFISTVSIGEMLIKIKDVCRILKISRNTLYNLQQKDSSFPKPIKFGDKKQAREDINPGGRG